MFTFQSGKFRDPHVANPAGDGEAGQAEASAPTFLEEQDQLCWGPDCPRLTPLLASARGFQGIKVCSALPAISPQCAGRGEDEGCREDGGEIFLLQSHVHLLSSYWVLCLAHGAKKEGLWARAQLMRVCLGLFRTVLVLLLPPACRTWLSKSLKLAEPQVPSLR